MNVSGGGDPGVHFEELELTSKSRNVATAVHRSSSAGLRQCFSQPSRLPPLRAPLLQMFVTNINTTGHTALPSQISETHQTFQYTPAITSNAHYTHFRTGSRKRALSVPFQPHYKHIQGSTDSHAVTVCLS